MAILGNDLEVPPRLPRTMYVMQVLLQLIAISAHSLGLHLLRHLFKDGEGGVEEVLIASVSSIEICGSLSILITSFGNLVFADSVSFHEFLHYRHARIITFSFILYTGMIYMALNKFCEVWFNIRYHLLFNNRKTKYLVVSTWSAGVVMGIAALVVQVNVGFQYVRVFMILMRIVFDFVFILIAAISFGYVFYKYRRARLPPLHCGAIQQPKESVFTTFRNSRFYLSTLLLLTFLCFVVIPDIAHLFLYADPDPASTVLAVLATLLISTSMLPNAFIYMYVHRQLKRSLVRRLRRVREACCCAPSATKIEQNLIRIRKTTDSEGTELTTTTKI